MSLFVCGICYPVAHLNVRSPGKLYSQQDQHIVPHYIFQSIFETLVNLTLTYYVMSFLLVLSSALAQALSTLYPTSHHLKRSTPIPCLQLSLVLPFNDSFCFSLDNNFLKALDLSYSTGWTLPTCYYSNLQKPNIMTSSIAQTHWPHFQVLNMFSNSCTSVNGYCK